MFGKTGSAVSAFFSVHSPPAPENIVEIKGRVENATAEPLSVTLTLARGSVAQASSQVLSIPAHTSAPYSFTGDFRGAYNVVAETSAYKITRGVYVEGALTSGPSFTFAGQGRTQSRVDVDASVLQVSVKGLPSLFKKNQAKAIKNRQGSVVGAAL